MNHAPEEYGELPDTAVTGGTFDGYEQEYFFSCPYCWQEISVLLDLSVPRQTYVEDCEICCNPIQISFAARNDRIADFRAEPMS